MKKQPIRHIMLKPAFEVFMGSTPIPYTDQGCPMVVLEQIPRSAELRICSEALAPKMGLEQIILDTLKQENMSLLDLSFNFSI